MDVVYNAAEIFEIAKELERNGVRFYRRAAKNFDDPERKQLFNDLAEMEHRHVAKLETVCAQFAQANQQQPTFDPDSEASVYLSCVTAGQVFDLNSDPREIVTGSETIEDIIKKAIEAEKDSLAFYMGLKQMDTSNDAKDEIETILAEEMTHIRILAELKF